MFIIFIHYKKSLETIDTYLTEHRAYLDIGYQNNYLIASGPKNPRTGGVLLSQLTDRNKLEEFLHNDPFSIHDAVEYEIIEFSPVKYHKNFEHFVKE